jgi:hypothetical protein
MSKHGPTTPSSLIENWAGTEQAAHQDSCLMCAVRALTEGDAPAVELDQVGDEVSGVLLRKGRRASAFMTDPGDLIPWVELWLGGTSRVRFTAWGNTARAALEAADAKMGDTLTIRFEGKMPILAGRFAGKEVRKYTATVIRGH